MTPENAIQVFLEGQQAAHSAAAAGKTAPECPYEHFSWQRQWWTTGFAAAARRTFTQAAVSETLLTEILNAVYAGAVEECERRECAKTLQGNGHHMAQEIVALVEQRLRERFKML